MEVLKELMKKGVIVIILLLFNTISFCATAVVVESVGKVFAKQQEMSVWEKCYPGMVLDESWWIKTYQKSKVVILLYDGSKIIISENTEIVLSKLTDTQKVIQQKSGKARFKVSKLQLGAKFETVTPTAVVSVRGTDFSVLVKEDLSSEVKVYTGVVNIRTVLGETVDLTAQQKIEILPDLPLKEIKKFDKQDLNETKNIIKEETKEVLIAEVRMDMTKEEVQRAAAVEQKIAEYQQGKSLIDVWGNRVRVEEYIVRKNMQPDQFKLVVLNERENRFDYLTWVATFNKELPQDLSLATRWLSWKEGKSQPEYYLTKSETGMSNTVDKVEWELKGDITENNGVWRYNQQLTSFKINNTEMIDKLPERIQIQISYPLGKNFAAEQYSVVFKDNSVAKETYYWIDDNGKVPSWKEYYSNGILSYNQELVFEYSGFEHPSKKIDLVVEPKIFLDSGIIQQK